MRWLVRIGVVLVVLIVLPVLALSFFLDSAASRAASYALGVDTRMTLVVRPLAGRVSLFGLSVANPEGFESRRFLGLDGGRFELDLGSLGEPTVASPLLRLEGVDVALERRGGRYNYQAILDHLKRFESGKAPAREAGDAGPGTQFVIRRLEILDVAADVDVSELLGDRGRARVEIPEIALRDVGGKKGVSLAELSDIVVKAILSAAVRGDVGLPKELAAALGGDLKGLRGVALQLGQDALSERVDQAVGEEAGRALRGLGGRLLGGEER
jgi:hypothetical protein